MKIPVKVTRIRDLRIEEYSYKEKVGSYWEVYNDASGEKIAFVYTEDALARIVY